MSALAATMGEKKGLGKIAAVFACGTALFSDGYQNGVGGSINTMLRRLYPAEYKLNQHGQLLSSMGFAGIVLGMLTFGYISDRVGRKSGMIIATLIVAAFATASTGAVGTDVAGMLQALIAYRFLTGIGIGAEYPSGSVAASENTEDPGVPKKMQHFLFAMATNVAIDWGFVIAALVPLIMVAICGEGRLDIAWRLSFAIGIIPPLLVLYWRLRMTEPLAYQKGAMKNAPTPYWLITKRYWKPMLGISLSWFIYDWISYPFGIYSSTILDAVIPGDAPLTTVFGWNVVINLFYIPGCMIGSLFLDRFNPKIMMISMLLVQAGVGFLMSGLYTQLSDNIGAFAVVYGLFLSFGEAGPGNCLGLLASKSFPTGIRGRMYGLMAAIGKVGAFIGTYTFPQIIAAFPDGPAQSSGPFWIASGLAIFSAIIVFVFVRELGTDCMATEDAAFLVYLEENGYDTSQLGLIGGSEGRLESLFAPGPKEDFVDDKEVVDVDEKVAV